MSHKEWLNINSLYYQIISQSIQGVQQNLLEYLSKKTFVQVVWQSYHFSIKELLSSERPVIKLTVKMHSDHAYLQDRQLKNDSQVISKSFIFMYISIYRYLNVIFYVCIKIKFFYQTMTWKNALLNWLGALFLQIPCPWHFNKKLAVFLMLAQVFLNEDLEICHTSC